MTIVDYESNYAPLAQLDRVAHYECEGREFESLMAHQLKTVETTCFDGFFFVFFIPIYVKKETKTPLFLLLGVAVAVAVNKKKGDLLQSPGSFVKNICVFYFDIVLCNFSIAILKTSDSFLL